MKSCSACKENKPLEDFAKCARHTDGRQYTCRSCMAAYREQRREELKKHYAEHYKANSTRIKRRVAGYRLTHLSKIRAYEETYRSHCLKAYRSLRARCLGKGPARSIVRYAGLPFCAKETFLAWAEIPANKRAWLAIKEQFNRTGKFRDRPSIDRLSTAAAVGYVPGNLRWAAHGDNAAKATLQRYRGPTAVSPYYTKEGTL